MPELPEVETIANDLNHALRGAVIKDFKVVNERTRRARPFLNLGENKLRQAVLGKKIKNINRRAKMLIFDVGDKYLLAHLKMTGQLILKKPRGRLLVGGHPIVGVGRDLPNKFTRAIISFTDGSRLYFNDVRRFGWIKFLTEPEFKEYHGKLGLEPLSGKFTLKNFTAPLSRKQNSVIKLALMDQKYLVGLGNIYADEALFAAGVKPTRRVKTLNSTEIRKIWQAAPRVLKLAIKHRGTSVSDYLDGAGKEGNFIKYLQVYGRAGGKCRRCGGMVRKTRLGGRGTHWCDGCQK